jgi:O-methyltransferase involved in polyketide biosynthesis
VIAGRPSATALLVALSVVRCGAQHGLPETSLSIANAALRRAGGAWPWLARCARTALGRRCLDAIERLALPGLAAHHCMRKRWLIERLRMLPSDARLLWLGVGFDGAGLALCRERPLRQLIELDHPDSLRLRARVLEDSALQHDIDLATPAHIARAALALPDDRARLVALCAQADARRNGVARPTTLVLEGVAMYLPARSLVWLLRQLAALPAPPRLLFTALAPTQPNGRGFAADHAGTRRWLARRGEPFLWRCAPLRLHALLRRHGYAVSATWDNDSFGEYAIDAVPMPRSSAC